MSEGSTVHVHVYKGLSLMSIHGFKGHMHATEVGKWSVDKGLHTQVFGTAKINVSCSSRCPRVRMS